MRYLFNFNSHAAMEKRKKARTDRAPKVPRMTNFFWCLNEVLVSKCLLYHSSGSLRHKQAERLRPTHKNIVTHAGDDILK